MQGDLECSPLECSDIVYRVLPRNGCIDRINSIVLPAAFLRRERPKDPDGVSVGCRCTPEEAQARLRKSYGVLSLHVGRLRDIGLDVVPDEPQHANITNLPYPQDDPVTAERLAGLIARQARIAI